MALTQEALYGIRQVKLLGITSRVQEEFRRAATDSMRLLARVSVFVNGQSVVMQAFGLCCVIAVVGLIAIAPDTLSPGRVVLFLFVATGVIPVVGASAREWGIVNEQVPAVVSLFRFLSEDDRVREVGGRLKRPVLVEESIVFDRVRLDYENRPRVLDDVSLRIRRGERLGIVGASGSGKTSLANLIPRLYDPTEGRILIDGTDLREFSLEFLRRRIGLLSQDVFVFNTSVLENIRLGRPDSTEEEIVAAARLAYAHDFIAALPDGYGTIIGDQGAKLSGGQRQRINIAQVFLRQPEVLVLDEATSALDSESEALVQDAIERLSRDRTVVLVAHRLSTLRAVDRLVVLDSGKIVEEGTWEGLRRSGGPFARMLEMQASAML
jgi:ABC-type multidrug transport system fused ATPase/permease subunit